MKAAVIKRSIAINGRKTSISLEDSFWDGLKEVAFKERTMPTKLVGQIAQSRTTINLSSAIRIYLLCYFIEAVRGGPKIDPSQSQIGRDVTIISTRCWASALCGDWHSSQPPGIALGLVCPSDFGLSRW